MKFRMKTMICLYLLAPLFSWTKVSASSSDEYLIRFPGPKPLLAKSFKSLGDGEYQFILDPSKSVQDGSKHIPVNFNIVKRTLEKRLKKYNVTVTAGSKENILTVKWDYKKADTGKFLQKLSKIKISGPKPGGVQLAGVMSDGGIRARTTARDPVAKEVQAKALTVKNNFLIFQVTKKGSDSVEIPVGVRLQLNPGTFKARTGQTFYFYPIEERNGIWTGSSFSFR